MATKLKNLVVENIMDSINRYGIQKEIQNMLNESLDSVDMSRREDLYKKIETGVPVQFNPPLCYTIDKEWLNSRNMGNWLNSYGVDEERQLQFGSMLYMGNNGITEIQSDGAVGTVKLANNYEWAVSSGNRKFVNDLQYQLSMVKMHKSQGSGAPD
jgi:hypothetical protein